MEERHVNCWEFRQCGREPGGHNVEELGVCPAATASHHDGANHGKNGGRICWALTGTYCEGQVQGTFAQKLCDCMTCGFYQKVEKQEDLFFVLYPV